MVGNYFVRIPGGSIVYIKGEHIKSTTVRGAVVYQLGYPKKDGSVFWQKDYISFNDVYPAKDAPVQIRRRFADKQKSLMLDQCYRQLRIHPEDKRFILAQKELLDHATIEEIIGYCVAQ